METLVHNPVILSGEETALLVELLEREQAKLPVEIRHTDNRAFREQLHRRLDLAGRVLEHLTEAG